MKSSKHPFDQLFKQKLQELTFEATAADTPDFLKKKLPNKKKRVQKSLGKLSMLFAVVGSFAFLQQKIQYRNEVLTANDINRENVSFLNQTEEQHSSENSVLQITEQSQKLQETATQELAQAGVISPSEDSDWEKLKTKQLNLKGNLSLFRFKVAPAIADIFEYEGAALVAQQASTEKTVICGLNQEKSKLVIARSKVANFKADSTATDEQQGVYRPSALDDDAVIQYNVFDKQSLYRRFQSESVHWGKVRTTKIMKPSREKKVKKPKAQDPKTNAQKQKTQKSQAQKPKAQAPKTPAPKAPVEKYTDGVTSSVHQHSTRQYIEKPQEYNYFIQDENIIFISDNINYVLVMEPDGNILSKAQIEITSPKMYYLGEKRVYFDQQTGKTYICMATLYHFNFYELEVANGQTTLLFQIDGVWPNPNFKIDAGNLTYTYRNKNMSRKMH
ncbi:MAG: hypothetical protein ACKOWW_00050 [Flavobacteriales bacterium]